MSTKITTHYFEWNGQKYFRGNAHLVEPGTYGEKKDPLGAKAYIEPAGKIKPLHLDGKLKYNTRTQVDWATVSGGELQAGADLNYLSLGKSGAISFDHSKAKSARLELINLSIDETPMIRMLNEAGIARDWLAKEGGDGRIVSEYWIVVDAELSEYFATTAGLSVGVKALGSHAGLTLSGGAQGTQTVTMSPGTTFAFKMHKVSDWSKGKDSVLKVEADYKGMS
jgi:hypothetical protein